MDCRCAPPAARLRRVGNYSRRCALCPRACRTSGARCVAMGHRLEPLSVGSACWMFTARARGKARGGRRVLPRTATRSDEQRGIRPVQRTDGRRSLLRVALSQSLAILSLPQKTEYQHQHRKVKGRLRSYAHRPWWSATLQFAVCADWVGGEGKTPSTVGESPRRALATPSSLASRRQTLNIGVWRTTRGTLSKSKTGNAYNYGLFTLRHVLFFLSESITAGYDHAQDSTAPRPHRR